MDPRPTEPDEVKTIGEWERALNVMLLGDVELQQKATHVEFDRMFSQNGGVGVNFADREGWLGQYGYAITRENMIDSSLSVPAPAAPESPEEPFKPRIL